LEETMIRRVAFAAAIATAFFFSGSANTAHAQLGVTVVGVGEFDTEDTYLVLGGVSVSPRTEGWSWIAGVSAYWLQYPVFGGLNDATRSVTAITPSVGIKNNFGSGSGSFRVGYSFKADDDDVDSDLPAFTEGGGGDGIVNTAQVDYWGSGSIAAQGIASYNYGSESFWGRGRLAKRLLSVGAGGISLGAEAAYLDSEGYNATKVGGLVMFNAGPGTQLNAVVGRKMPSAGSDATYFTFEVVLFPH
jgi:hypothetical protein